MSSWYERNTGGRGQIKRALIAPVCDLMVEAARAIEGDPDTESAGYKLAQEHGLTYTPAPVTRQTVTAMIDDLARGFQAYHPVRKYYDCATDRAILMLANEIMKEAGAMAERSLKSRRSERALEALKAAPKEEIDIQEGLSILAAVYSGTINPLSVEHQPYTNTWVISFMARGYRKRYFGNTLQEAIYSAINED